MVWSELEAGEPGVVAGEEGQVRQGAECATGHELSWEKAGKREEVTTELMGVLVT